MEITLATPALLFPAISLLFLAYANRFLALARVIRELHNTYRSKPDALIAEQLKILRSRLFMIRNMQGLGIASFFTCVLCMFLLFAGSQLLGKIFFVLSLALLMGSLVVALREIQISVRALSLHLRDLDK